VPELCAAALAAAASSSSESTKWTLSSLRNAPLSPANALFREVTRPSNASFTGAKEMKFRSSWTKGLLLGDEWRVVGGGGWLLPTPPTAIFDDEGGRGGGEAGF